MTITCIGCGLVLRHDAGVQHRGEPKGERDDQGGFISCPACGHRLAYMDLDPNESGREAGQ